MSTSFINVTVTAAAASQYSPPINLGGKKMVGIYQSNTGGGISYAKLQVAADQVTPANWLPVQYPGITGIYPFPVGFYGIQYVPVVDALQVLPDVVRLDLGSVPGTDVTYVLVLEDGCSINITGC